MVGSYMENSGVFEWHKRIKEGHETMEDDNALTFFDIKDINHFEFIPQGQSVNQTEWKQ
jgi:hypothetical protein